MRQFEHDAYEMMTRFIDSDEAVVALDIGANVGDTAQRIVQIFPNARVYALEPVSDVYETLVERTAGLKGVKTFRLAVGERPGEVEFNITRNRWCSSLLPPSERGRAYYGDWYDVVRTERVPIVRLDDFAAQQGLERVDILKIDVQGLELPVLKGAVNLLRNGQVKAVQCEAQLVAEYEGASTFAEIDLFFRQAGFTIHQVHDLEVKGEEQQSSYLDAMWVRNDVLDALRKQPRKRFEPVCVVRARKALARCAAMGKQRAALYGSGQHTQKIAAALESPPMPVVAIIDDNPARQGQTMLGLPIVSAQRALQMGVDAVVLSSDRHEAALWAQSAGIRAAGVPVLGLYGTYADAIVEPAPVNATATARRSA